MAFELHPGLHKVTFWGQLGRVACELVIIYYNISVNLALLKL